MDNFYSNRDLYPYLHDFMPQLAGFLNFTAKEIKNVAAEYEKRNPYVVGIYPMIESEIDLSRDVIEFHVTFSEPMATNCEGYKLLGNRLENIDIPAEWQIAGWKDESTYLIRLKPEWIAAGEIYGFVLNRNFTLSKKTYPLLEDFRATFKTKKL